jgi:ketosteroid isomerase-like protein
VNRQFWRFCRCGRAACVIGTIGSSGWEVGGGEGSECGPSGPQQDILRAGYAAFNRQDIPGIIGRFDENIEWTEPELVYGPPGGTPHGCDEVLRKVCEPIADQFDSVKLRLKGVSQTLDVPFVHVWQLRDGKCVSMRNDVDVVELYGRQEMRRAGNAVTLSMRSSAATSKRRPAAAMSMVAAVGPAGRHLLLYAALVYR